MEENIEGNLLSRAKSKQVRIGSQKVEEESEDRKGNLRGTEKKKALKTNTTIRNKHAREQ